MRIHFYAAFVALSGCWSEEAPPASVASHEEGLAIVGTVQVGSGAPTTGDLDPNLLARDLFSACFDEVQTAFPAICGSGKSGPADAGPCDGHECMLQALLCTGHEFMEIADQVSAFTITTRRLGTTDTGPTRRRGATVSYTIPPQAAEDRTLAYQLASQAFRTAGQRGVAAIDSDSCMDQMMATAGSTDPAQNRAEIFAVGYGDVVQAFTEATDKLVRNQLQVAGEKSQRFRDFSEAREHMWNDDENSIRAGLVAMTRMDDPTQNREDLSLAACSRPAANDAVADAIGFLRAKPVAAILDPFADDMAVVTAAYEAFAAEFPELYGGDPPDAFLARFGLSMTDVAQARQYLQDEHEVFSRTILEIDPGNGLVAGLATPPTPLPAAVTLAKTAGSIGLSSTSITDPLYSGSGALQTLDLLRWGARKALRRAAGLPEAIRPVLSAAATMAEIQSGHQRIEVVAGGPYPEPPPSDVDASPYPVGLTEVRLHGVEENEEYFLVSSIDGLRCVLDGSVEGVPCNPDDYILARNPSFVAGDTYGQQLDGTFRFTIGPISEPIFVISHNSPNEVLGGFDPIEVTGGGGLLFSVGGAIQDRVGRIVEPLTIDCGRPADSCAGLPADLVVPLESEITEDNDPYENSWRHYLDLAREAAAEADALGEDLIRAGLEADLRGEAARDELEAICNGVVNVPDIFSAGANPGDGEPEDVLAQPDPSLANCLPGGEATRRLDWATLGDVPLCAWQADDIRVPCLCPEGRQCPPRPCPVKSTGDCTGRFGEMAVGFSLIPNTGEGEDEVETLNLHPAPESDGVDGPVDCSLLGDLRWGVEIIDGRARELTAEGRVAKIEELQRSWMSYGLLHDLVSEALYDEDFREKVSISMGGSAVLSTEDESVWPCTPPQQADALDRASRVFDEDTPRCGGNQVERSEYIVRLRRAFGTLGLISGALDGNMRRSWAAPDCTGRGPVDQSETQDRCAQVWDDDIEQRMSCQGLDQGCRCMVEHVEDEPSRYGAISCDQGARFDHTIQIFAPEATATHALWGVRDDLNGCNPNGDDPDVSIPDVLCGIGLYLDDPAAGDPFPFEWSDLYSFNRCRPSECADRQQGGLGQQEEACCAGRPIDRGIFVQPDDLLDPDPAFVGERIDAYSITRDDIFDALSLGCFMISSLGGGPCSTFDPLHPPEIPTVRSIGDLRRVENFIECGVNSIRTSTSRVLLAGVPAVVADTIGAGGPASLAGGYGGEHLDALIAIQRDIEQIASASVRVQNALRQAKNATSSTRQSLAINNVEREITQLQSIGELLARITNAMAGAFTSFGVSSADVPAQIVINRMIDDLQGELADLREGQILNEYSSQVGDILERLVGIASELRDTVFVLNGDLDKLKSLESRALSAAARAAFMDADASGRVFNVTTVMRRRYNTLRIRYERARDRARQMAFIARRAVEQRFGVELADLNRDLMLVEAPATWADDVCNFEGIDYARIRDAEAVDEQGNPIADNYVDGYLGDYVEHLTLFVESYPFDFPFQDGSDLAVISLRDDYYRTRASCEVEVPNLLASSDSMASGLDGAVLAPWTVEGCTEVDGVLVPCMELQSEPGLDRICTDEGGAPIECPEPQIEPGLNRIADTAAPFTGVVVQEVEVPVGPATLLVSFRDLFREGAAPDDDFDIDEPVAFRVAVERVGGSLTELAELVDMPNVEAAEPRVLLVDIREAGTIRVTIDPSLDPAAPGDLWLSELQLEILDHGRALAEDPEPAEYVPTTASGVAVQEVCPDLDGAVLRQRFFEPGCEQICPAGLGRECGRDSENVISTSCFHEATFGLSLEQVERGELIPSAQVALGNFNYRHDLIAVNIVGTNVRDCSSSDEPATCYSNAFVPFTLIHEGEDIPIRNHDGETVPFDFERGFIEHGKALASETVLTNPLSSSSETLLTPYYKQEFRGRPLMGEYTLRIWDDPALNWENVEDVQLVFRYRYWTRFER